MDRDVVVIGAGLIGLSVAAAVFDRFPGADVTVVDKEEAVASHQSSHNSGVVHSGLYYRPGSLKARLCVEGRRRLERLCHSEAIPFRRSGKLVIAARLSELAALDELERRGRANGLTGLTRLGSGEIATVEPGATGIAALHVPEAAVIDFPAVAAVLADAVRHRGGEILTGHRVESIRPGEPLSAVRVGETELRARLVVNCAGLHADRIASMAGVRPPVRIVPFRGEYYLLAPGASERVRALIYPVPNPRFPFLGVHFTRRIDGSVEVGPNAVLALGREQYRGRPVSWGDLGETLTTPGFARLALRHWWTGALELARSRSRLLYARSAARLVPGVTGSDLLPGGSGVRAQAIAPDGRLVDDFVIVEAGSTVHVLNAPSPGATASLAIGDHIAALAGRHLGA